MLGTNREVSRILLVVDRYERQQDSANCLHSRPSGLKRNAELAPGGAHCYRNLAVSNSSSATVGAAVATKLKCDLSGIIAPPRRRVSPIPKIFGALRIGAMVPPATAQTVNITKKSS